MDIDNDKSHLISESITKENVEVDIVQGATIVYNKVSYNIPVKIKRKTQVKTVLNECSGVMSVGLNAILGPTGSGKTSLLDVLAGRKEKKFLSGQVLVNGEYQNKNFRLSSGFVVQDDIVMGTLTVRENIAFSASLRMSRKYSKEERKRQVDNVIKDLGLQNCADVRVGTEALRGISGGERKRTNIGMELIMQPEVLFLDEPTTGLDSTTASSVMRLLQKLAQKGRTIIFSIHQPRYSIFKLFDTLTLLSDGRTIYHGPSGTSLQYFESLGHHCEKHNNPADFYLDVISDDTYINEIETELSCQYLNSSYHKEVCLKADEAVTSANDVLSDVVDTTVHHKEIPSYRTSLLTQIGVVCKRALLNLVRNPKGFLLQIFVSLVFSTMVGGIYFQLDANENGIQNRTGVFFFLIMNMIFSNLSAIIVFIREREVFRHESANGYYRVSAYFIAKLTCDLLPMRVIPLILFAVISYFMIGLRRDIIHFLIFVLVLMFSSLAGSALCIFVSSSVNAFEVANLLVGLSFVLMMLFGGFLVNLSDIPEVLRWLKYLSIFKYGLTGLEINELKGMTFGSSCGIYKNETCPTGSQFLDLQGIGSRDLWLDVGILAAFILGFYLLTYIQLLRMKKFR